jgi:hypothetical protein
MSYESDNAFGGQWDLGGIVVEQIISYPISHMIHEAADEAGLDLSNPTRSIASFIASGFLGTFLGSFLGPIGSILGGALGEALATTSRYPGDRTKEERLLQEQALMVLKVKAVGTALEITQEHVSNATWNAIVDQYQMRLERLGNRQATTREAFDIGVNIINDSIRSVDQNVYWNFNKVYQAARRELGV